MHKPFNIRYVLNLVLLVSLAGCAGETPPPTSDPTPILSGDQMLRESQGMAQLGSRWQQGKQMVERGQNLQREGQAKIAEGRHMITEGEKIMRESEENYKTIKQ